MTVAIVIFALSLLGIITLFALKLRELSTKRALFPQLHERADSGALEVKRLAAELQMEFKKLPPEIASLSRLVLHDAALALNADKIRIQFCSVVCDNFVTRSL